MEDEAAPLQQQHPSASAAAGEDPAPPSAAKEEEADEEREQQQKQEEEEEAGGEAAAAVPAGATPTPAARQPPPSPPATAALLAVFGIIQDGAGAAEPAALEGEEGASTSDPIHVRCSTCSLCRRRRAPFPSRPHLQPSPSPPPHPPQAELLDAAEQAKHAVEGLAREAKEGLSSIATGLTSWWSTLDPAAEFALPQLGGGGASAGGGGGGGRAAPAPEADELRTQLGLEAGEEVMESFRCELLQSYTCSNNFFTPVQLVSAGEGGRG